MAKSKHKDITKQKELPIYSGSSFL